MRCGRKDARTVTRPVRHPVSCQLRLTARRSGTSWAWTGTRSGSYPARCGRSRRRRWLSRITLSTPAAAVGGSGPAVFDGLSHHAAFPPALAKRIILGWSPTGICTACGEGRLRVALVEYDRQGRTTNGPQSVARRYESPGRDVRAVRSTTITGYVCACTPYTDHPERRQLSVTPSRSLGRGHQDNAARAAAAGSRHHGNDWPDRQPVRDYRFGRWTPAPTRPALVVDPFGGTGTTALVADVLGRDGLTVDLSADYCRLAAWRTNDPGERARALGVPKPPPVPDGQGDLFGDEVA